jgi:hypothetical protein
MVNSILRTLGGKWLARQFRAAAEGRLGPLPQRIVLFGRGHLTETSFALGCLLVPALLATGNEAAAAWMGVLAGAGVSAGLVRKAWSEEVPPEVLASGWYLFLKNHASDVATLFGIAAASVQACDPSTVELLARAHLTCGSASVLLAIVAAIWGHLGLSAAARLSPPPLPAARPAGDWPPVTRQIPPPPPLPGPRPAGMV